jgi:alkanesulfonate monooxygenase SsuD/methylene tetrahydromethanopterin reductase-like flavin-dependent oxidoreductase (luciferase family)
MTADDHPVKIGLSFPNFGLFADPAILVDLARRADDAGWDGFFVWDHVVVGDGVPVADPWVTLGAVAHATRRLRIGPMVAALPRHRPWIVARQAVSLDHLSDGRMILGVGLGFPPDVEFGTFGDAQNERTRADMLDEALEIICGVWSGRPFAHSGVHYRVESTTFAPIPIQRPRIPIWVAGMLPNRRPLRRAARYDGVIPIRSDMAPLTVNDIADTRAYIATHRTATRPVDFAVAGPPIDRAEMQDMAAAGLTWYLAGPNPSGESIDDIRRWVSAGPTDYVFGDR